MRTLLCGKFSQKPTWLAASVIHLAALLAGPSANKKLKSFAIAHWDAPKAARPLAWRYVKRAQSMNPYIIDILCEPAGESEQAVGGHAVVCAITNTEKEAEAMAINLVMSHSFLVKSVVCVNLKNSSPDDEFQELEDTLHHQALQRTPPCALFLSSHKRGLQESEFHVVSDPTSNTSKH